MLIDIGKVDPIAFMKKRQLETRQILQAVASSSILKSAWRTLQSNYDSGCAYVDTDISMLPEIAFEDDEPTKLSIVFRVYGDDIVSSGPSKTVKLIIEPASGKWSLKEGDAMPARGKISNFKKPDAGDISQLETLVSDSVSRLDGQTPGLYLSRAMAEESGKKGNRLRKPAVKVLTLAS